MNWYKVLAHDLTCGLLRKRYLAAIFIFLLPCISLWMELRTYGGGSFMDYLLSCFCGAKRITGKAGEPAIAMPVRWILAVGASLYLNLDYFLGDITLFGQQILVRCSNRCSWFWSKCLWNVLACTEYVCIGCITVFLFTAITGGALSLFNTSTLAPILFQDSVALPLSLSIPQGLTIGLILPLATMIALNLLEMTLCLYVKPIIAFIICMLLLVLPLFWDSPLALSIGAMAIRSVFVVESGIHAASSAGVVAAVIVGSVFAGCNRFRLMDILGLEE